MNVNVGFRALPPELRRAAAQRQLRIRRTQANTSLGLIDWLGRDRVDNVDGESADWSARHMQYIAGQLERVTRGELTRLILCAPPRHGKSSLTTIRYPVARLARDPRTRVAVGSYNTLQAARFGRASRTIARRRCPSLNKERQAATEWETTEGGIYRGCSVGAPPTGVGFQLLIIDDPIKKREEADSRSRRELIWDWFDQDMRSRLEPGGAVILVMTRWHQDDLAGRLLEREGDKWECINLTALAEEGDPLGRAIGEPLWPARWSREALAEVMPTEPYGREALYFGRPRAKEGNYLPTTKLRRVSADEFRVLLETEELAFARYWDIAGTASDRADYTVGALAAGPCSRKQYYWLDTVRGQWEPRDRNRMMRAIAARDVERYGEGVSVYVPRDSRNETGKEVAEGLLEALDGYRAEIVKPLGKDASRVDGLCTVMDYGRLALVESVWPEYHDRSDQLFGREAWDAAIDELASFPAGMKDDVVDGLVGAYTAVARHGDLDMLFASQVESEPDEVSDEDEDEDEVGGIDELL